MNNPFGYFIVPQVWTPSVLQSGLPIGNSGLQALTLEQQQQQQHQQLMQCPLAANSIYNCLSSDPSVVSVNSNAGKKADTQHTIVGKPVMYGSKSEKKNPDAPNGDPAQTESTSDYASDEHASDVNSESGTLISSDSGRPDSTRNGASSLSPRTIESNVGKQIAKKSTPSAQGPAPATSKSETIPTSTTSNARNSAKLVYHRKPEHLAVSGANQSKPEAKKSPNPADEQKMTIAKSDSSLQKYKRRLTDKEADKEANADGSTAVKRAKVLGDTTSAAPPPPPPPPPPPTTGSEAASSVKTATTGETHSNTLLAADGTLLSTASLAHDDDMDLDDDPSGEEGAPATGGGESNATLQKSPAKPASVPSSRSPRVGSRSMMLPVSEAFESVATTWVTAPTVSSHSMSHYGAPGGVLVPASAGSVPASFYNPLAAIQAQVNPFAASPFHMAAAAGNHPLTLVNHMHPASPQFVLPGAAHNVFALRLQQMQQMQQIQQMQQMQQLQQFQQAAASHSLQQQLQQAAASQTLQQLQQLHAAAAAQGLQLPGSAAGQLYAAHQPAASASNQLFAPQPHALSYPEELDPLRMILQKR